MTGIGVSQGTDSLQEILEEMTEVTVGQDQDHGQVQTQAGLDASDVKNIIFPRIVPS